MELYEMNDQLVNKNIMTLFQDILLIESQKSSQKEIDHTISIINKLYKEWKATGRRKNAVDIISTTVNKLVTIDPTIVDKIHDATRIKLATLIIRCFDIPYWKNVYEKEKIFKRLLDLIQRVSNEHPNVDGSGGNVAEIIMTRLSASISYSSENKNVFVGYEPSISKSYLKYMFGKEIPDHIFRMEAMKLPNRFEELVNILKINQDKAISILGNNAKK